MREEIEYSDESILTQDAIASLAAHMADPLPPDSVKQIIRNHLIRVLWIKIEESHRVGNGNDE